MGRLGCQILQTGSFKTHNDFKPKLDYRAEATAQTGSSDPSGLPLCVNTKANQRSRVTSTLVSWSAPWIIDLTHSQSLGAESGDAVPHLVLTAAQRDKRHVTVAQVKRSRARPLQSLLRPHVAIVLHEKKWETMAGEVTC